MNSFNHYAFGSVGRWMFGTVAGIDTEGPGYKRIIIRPQHGGGFSYAKAGYESIHGKIESDWKIEGRTFTLNVTIPPNTTATVYVPARDPESVTESGWPAAVSEGVRFLRMEGDKVVYEVGSGNYVFVSGT
jgi:alpha-L-rhamnosidase